MKIKFLICLVLFVAMGMTSFASVSSAPDIAKAEDANPLSPNAVVIKTRNGKVVNSIVMMFDKNPVIKFKENRGFIVIKDSDKEETIKVNNLVSMSPCYVEPLSLPKLSDDITVVVTRVGAGEYRLSLQQAASVELFTSSGAMVYHQDDAVGEVNLSLDGYGSGVYILKIGTEIIKITR